MLDRSSVRDRGMIGMLVILGTDECQLIDNDRQRVSSKRRHDEQWTEANHSPRLNHHYMYDQDHIHVCIDTLRSTDYRVHVTTEERYIMRSRYKTIQCVP